MASMVRLVLPQSAPAEPIAAKIAAKWGGVSVLPGWGLWEQIREPVYVFYCACRGPLPGIRAWWTQFASDLQFEHNQQSVFVAYESGAYELVGGTDPQHNGRYASPDLTSDPAVSVERQAQRRREGV